jgi:DNA-binding Lrp family transcriptional regulator
VPTRAYILINTDAGQAEAVVRALRQLPGVASADLVTGGYDVVASVAGDDVNAIGRLVLNPIHGIAGLKTTNTLIVVV